MDIPTGGGSVSEAERRQYNGAHDMERPPLTAENGRAAESAPSRGERPEGRQLVRGQRETVLEVRGGGKERAWHALSGYERAPSPTYEGSPHPISGYERLSVERAHTMKDFEKQITELKKENFNLKLRIYFLEEQVQRRCDTSNDELHRMNIELKVEVESLKHDYQEKHNLLVRASKAMESLAGEHELAVQRLREDHLRHLQDMEDTHLRHLQDMEDTQSRKLQLFETEIQQQKAELEKMCVLLDQERMQRFTTEERLMTIKEQYTKSVAILEERDWIIQCLNDTVHSKDALIAQLEKQIASMMPYEASGDKMGKNGSNLYLEGGTKDSSDTPNLIHNLDGKEDDVNEWQKKIKEMDNLINELQQKLETNKASLVAEEKNSLKRDKAIQGLTLALKKKSKENEKLVSEINNLNAALSKAGEATQQSHLKESLHPEYKKLIFTLQAEQDMYNRLLKYERESGSLQKELESIAMLRRWLEENIQANQELRKIMEAQIMARYKGDDSMSFLGDQTSYLSICLDHLDQNEYFYAGGPQGTAISKNNMHEVFNHLREDAGTQTQSEVPSGRNLDHRHSEMSFIERSRDQEDGDNNTKPSRNKQNTISSATQTEPGAFPDKSLAVNVSGLPKERTELMQTLQDGELHFSSQRLSQKTGNTSKIQEYNFTRNAKKSRLPVLLTSSLNTKLKTDFARILAKEDDRRCLEKESQIESSWLDDLSRSAESDIESPKENKNVVFENHVSDRNNKSQEQRDPVEQAINRDLQLENYRLKGESMGAESEHTTPKASEELKESDLFNAKPRESTEWALKNLQAENSRLCEQLQEAQMENKTLKANEDLLRNKSSKHNLSNSKEEQRHSTEQALQKDLQAENYQLSEQLKRARMEIETLTAAEDNLLDLSSDIKGKRKSAHQKLQVENDHLSELLEQAQREIKTLKANEELLRNKDSDGDLHSSKKESWKTTGQTLQEDLQAENYRLSEQLKRAEMEIERLQANEKLAKHKDVVPDLSGSIKELKESTDLELQAENYRLSEQLKQAQMEIETLKGNEEMLRHKASDLSDAKNEQNSTEPALQKELLAENCRLSELLRCAEMEIETLKANEELLRSEAFEHDLHKTKEDKASAEQALQKELQAENYQLSEQLKRAQIEIEALKASEELLKAEASEHDFCNSKEEQKKSTERAFQKELQAENFRLSEQLAQAQMEIKRFQANEDVIERKDIAPDLSYSIKEFTQQSLQKELQVEQSRLSERLKTAQMAIETLQAERTSTGSSNDSMKLNGSDADDDLSEQSYLDKTITNSVNVHEVDATSDFGDEVCRPDVISHNAVALRCHHDSHCTECANNRGILPLPTSKSQRASARHSSSKYTKVSLSGRSFDDTTSLSKYDLLVQSQARELSLQRQKIKESHNLSVICSKNFYNILKAFENLFPASTLDSNITLGFQEQITQTVEWLKELEYKLSDAFYGEEDAYSDHSVDSLLYTPSRLVPGHRMWADKHGCHVLGLVEDYNALRKQILESKNVLEEMEAFIDHGVQTAVLNMTDHFGNIFYEKLTRTKQSLEEAGCLLKLLWRVSLPLQNHSPYSTNQEEDVNLEVTRLRKRVVEQEKLLSGMVKRVYSENQMKEDIEKLILDQLAMTHDILKRAKGNLEVQVVDKLQ